MESLHWGANLTAGPTEPWAPHSSPQAEGSTANNAFSAFVHTGLRNLPSPILVNSLTHYYALLCGDPAKLWCVTGSKTSKDLAGRSSGHHASLKDAPSTVSKVTWWELGTNISQMRVLRLHPGKGIQRIQEMGGGASGPGFFIFVITAVKTFTERG